MNAVIYRLPHTEVWFLERCLSCSQFTYVRILLGSVKICSLSIANILSRKKGPWQIKWDYLFDSIMDFKNTVIIGSWWHLDVQTRPKWRGNCCPPSIPMKTAVCRGPLVRFNSCFTRHEAMTWAMGQANVPVGITWTIIFHGEWMAWKGPYWPTAMFQCPVLPALTVVTIVVANWYNYWTCIMIDHDYSMSTGA